MHINGLGEPAYTLRFRQTWGFYEGLASVEDERGWLHIGTDGSGLSPERYEWCGNFQEGRCPVRERGGGYFHITTGGAPAYAAKHRYAGDFREGFAVVRYASDGLCGHIDGEGRAVHAGRFIDLDVYHKGHARARDERGWFHIDVAGRALYEARFAQLEAFYNGQAAAETPCGERVIVDATGRAIHRLAPRMGE
jgi:hypothetical protein